MRIGKLLELKGREVVTVRPEATVWEMMAALKRHRIGAVVVSDDGRWPVGTAGPDDEVESLMDVMTTNRIRHVPVVDGVALVGIVSIGDVVKHRVDALEGDNRALHDYINAR